MAEQVAGANRRWSSPFRCRGSHRESAVAQLFSLGSSATLMKKYTIIRFALAVDQFDLRGQLRPPVVGWAFRDCCAILAPQREQ